MAQQTAVEWLIDWMGKNQYFIGNDLIKAVEQAKAMEKEQIETAYGDGQENGIDCNKKLSNGNNCNIITAMQYYDQTYNK